MKPVNDRILSELLARARENQERAYAPYSNYSVGACILAASGVRYDGCNIENAAYGPSNCAERTAMFTAVCAGEREFDAIAITSSGVLPAFPCGICRQVLSEFCEPEMPVICAGRDGNVVRLTLGELLPHSFGRKDLNK